MTHFESIIKVTKEAYKCELLKSEHDYSRIKSQTKEIEDQISRLMGLFERGNIDTDILEERINRLQEEKLNLEKIIENKLQMRTVLELAESEINDELIKEFINNFETLLNDSNLELMRDFIINFISKIEIFRKDQRSKKRRKVNIYGRIPAFTMIEMALPRGVEPLSPA